MIASSSSRKLEPQSKLNPRSASSNKSIDRPTSLSEALSGPTANTSDNNNHHHHHNNNNHHHNHNNNNNNKNKDKDTNDSSSSTTPTITSHSPSISLPPFDSHKRYSLHFLLSLSENNYKCEKSAEFDRFGILTEEPNSSVPIFDHNNNNKSSSSNNNTATTKSRVPHDRDRGEKGGAGGGGDRGYSIRYMDDRDRDRNQRPEWLDDNGSSSDNYDDRSSLSLEKERERWKEGGGRGGGRDRDRFTVDDDRDHRRDDNRRSNWRDHDDRDNRDNRRGGGHRDRWGDDRSYRDHRYDDDERPAWADDNETFDNDFDFGGARLESDHHRDAPPSLAPGQSMNDLLLKEKLEYAKKFNERKEKEKKELETELEEARTALANTKLIPDAKSTTTPPSAPSVPLSEMDFSKFPPEVQKLFIGALKLAEPIKDGPGANVRPPPGLVRNTESNNNNSNATPAPTTNNNETPLQASPPPASVSPSVPDSTVPKTTKAPEEEKKPAPASHSKGLWGETGLGFSTPLSFTMIPSAAAFAPPAPNDQALKSTIAPISANNALDAAAAAFNAAPNVSQPSVLKLHQQRQQQQLVPPPSAPSLPINNAAVGAHSMPVLSHTSIPSGPPPTAAGISPPVPPPSMQKIRVDDIFKLFQNQPVQNLPPMPNDASPHQQPLAYMGSLNTPEDKQRMQDRIQELVSRAGVRKAQNAQYRNHTPNINPVPMTSIPPSNNQPQPLPPHNFPLHSSSVAAPINPYYQNYQQPPPPQERINQYPPHLSPHDLRQQQQQQYEADMMSRSSHHSLGVGGHHQRIPQPSHQPSFAPLNQTPSFNTNNQFNNNQWGMNPIPKHQQSTAPLHQMPPPPPHSYINNLMNQSGHPMMGYPPQQRR